MTVLEKLRLEGIVPAVKIEDANDAVPLAKALIAGGIRACEITFRTDAAADAIKLINESCPEAILGAGTVLTTEQVDKAVACGAKFIVSPGINPDVVKHCQKVGVPVVPGVSTASEIEIAIGLGLKTVKFFPAESMGGINTIKALSGPYGSMTFLPTGGVNQANMLNYLKNKKIFAVGGSWMVPAAAIKEKNFDEITRLAKSAVTEMLGMKLVHLGINNENEDECNKVCAMFSMMMGQPIIPHSKANFVGTDFEVMKLNFRGKNGHIAIGTNDIERAVYHCENMGFEFDPKPEAPYKAIYFKDEIGGFAVHLLQL